MSPTAGRGATQTESNERPLHDGVRRPDLFGLTVVCVTGMTRPVVYDSTAIYSVVARDFPVQISQDYAPAVRAAKTALRLTGRFGVGIPHAREVRGQGECRVGLSRRARVSYTWHALDPLLRTPGDCGGAAGPER
jgi:hypothetical protein